MIKGWLGNSAAAALVLLLALTGLAQEAGAGLGLGEARVNSFLGQPLDVQIGLLQPRPEAVDSLSVEIASPEDYARLGIPADALGLGLRVELDRTVDPPVLQLRSSRPVTDPFVQLLINARWASGRMLREYTLFIDPATVPVAPPIRQREPAVAAPPAAQEQLAEPVPEPPAAEAGPARAVVTELPEETTEPAEQTQPIVETRRETPAERVGPVRSGQTLWSIAQAWRPDDTMSMAQVMLAILDQNPQAFINDNVNFLRVGAELLMPDRSAVQAIEPDVAGRRIREQHQAWRAATTPPVVPETAAVIEAPPAAEPEPERAAAAAAAEETAEPPVLASEEVQAPDEVWSEQLPDLPRLELTSADQEFLTDQAFGVERERLERELAGLVQELRSDGIESPALAAEIDQIRQAIESADVGGLMVASEGLARLEQQARDLRMEQERLAEASEPAPEPAVAVVAVTAEESDSNWMRFLLPALALLLVLAVVALWRRSRSRADEPQQQPEIEPTSSVTAASSSAADPDADPIDAELAELYRLAERGDKEAFGAAFTALHRRLNNTADARWKAAAALAATVVPAHPLLTSLKDARAPEPEVESVRTDAGSRELMDWLDAGDESEPGESTGATEVQGLTGNLDDLDPDGRVDRPAAPGDEDEAADLSRLSNRLGPEDEPTVEAEDDSDVDRIKPVVQDTGGGVIGAERPADQAAAGDQPLYLDFEFTVEDEVTPEVHDDALVSAESPPLESASGQLELASDLNPGDADRDEEDWFKLEPSDDQEMVTQPSDEAAAAKETLSDDDVELKLDLARAYLSMNDADSARALLEEIVADGTQKHREQAGRLLDNLK